MPTTRTAQGLSDRSDAFICRAETNGKPRLTNDAPALRAVASKSQSFPGPDAAFGTARGAAQYAADLGRTMADEDSPRLTYRSVSLIAAYIPTPISHGDSRFPSGLRRSAGSPDGRLVQGSHGGRGLGGAIGFDSHMKTGIGKARRAASTDLRALEPGAPAHPDTLRRRDTEQKDARPRLAS